MFVSTGCLSDMCVAGEYGVSVLPCISFTVCTVCVCFVIQRFAWVSQYLGICTVCE